MFYSIINCASFINLPKTQLVIQFRGLCLLAKGSTKLLFDLAQYFDFLEIKVFD